MIKTGGTYILIFMPRFDLLLILLSQSSRDVMVENPPVDDGHCVSLA